ncbi:hypothetical protein AYI70_g9587, partial [Smittium culicis]
MKITISMFALACSTVFSVMASPAVENAVSGSDTNALFKRSGGSGGGHSGGNGGGRRGGHGGGRRGGHRGGRGRRYHGYGRDWYFDDSSDISFIQGLVYQPSEYYGQRFQYLYQNSPDFSNYWNSD